MVLEFKYKKTGYVVEVRKNLIGNGKFSVKSRLTEL